jgi:PPM family protein phosphatase
MSVWSSVTNAVRALFGSRNGEGGGNDLPFALVDLDYRNGTPAPAPRGRHEPQRARPPTSASGPEGHPPASTWVEAGQVRFEEPPEGTLRLLPGWLEIRSGGGEGREIRFVHLPGTEPEVTFGRGPGPAYQHVQLESPTVSRLHARLRFKEGGWALRNESGTNPTVVNGSPMNGSRPFVPLEDGDRIEMGEVVFLFRHPSQQARAPVRASWFTDRGPREANQDFVAVRRFDDGRELAAVCDGMGSSPSAALAGEIAIETLVAELEGGGPLLDAVHVANRAVLTRAGDSAEDEGMGTTLLALLRQGDRYEIAHVGDSRAYRVDESGARPLTTDHSFVAEAVREGTMSHEEAARSPWRNAVTRHLGAEPDVDADLVGPFSAEEPHLVVLCSDGVHSVLPAEGLEKVIRGAPDLRAMARAIGEEALRLGSKDNVAAVVMQFGAGLQ